MAKIWIISDTHFGVRNNSKKWEDIMYSWMNDYFFPLIETEKEEGDVLVHLGDVFDNRQSVSLSSMNLAINFFERLSKEFKQIRVLCGNHDAYYTTNNDISSIECLKYIPNVKIIKTPETDIILGKRVLFLPWMEDKKTFYKSISESSPDVLFCHAEFYGCVMNSYGTKSEHDFNVPDILHIYSGHIHHRENYKNLVYVGSPYQITQNDRNNSKGVWTYAPQENEERFFYNNISPEFIRVSYSSISDMTLSEFKHMCKNKFVEIEANSALMSKCFFQKLLTLVQDCGIMDILFVPAKQTNENIKNINITNCASISDMLDEYIDDYVDCNENMKKSIKKLSKKLINE